LLFAHNTSSIEAVYEHQGESTVFLYNFNKFRY